MLNTHMTMNDAFRQVAESRRKQLALVCGDSRLTYGELLDRAARLAMGLRRLGVMKGERVMVLLPPGADLACLFFAVAEIGGIMVPLNPQLRPRSLGQLLEDASPVVLVQERALVEGAFSRPASLKHIVLVEQGAFYPSLDEVADRESHKPSPRDDVAPEDPLALLYTSGTTGQPKGILHSHRGLIAPVVASLKVRELWLHWPNLKTISQTAKAVRRYRNRLLRAVGRPQTFISTIGWHTISGVELMLQGLLMGDQMVVMPQFHPRMAMELIQREKATIMVALPTAYQAMLSLVGFHSYDTSSLLICGTGTMPCPPELARRIQKEFGCALHIGFGATETAGGIAIPSIADSDELQATSVGRPLPGVQVKIVDEDRIDLPAGEVGELLCRGDSIMLGYYRQPDSTSSVIDSDGWYATGDLARLDAEGYLHIVGRKKDMIIRGGQNIYPVDIETYLAGHHKIMEAAVVGVPSRLSGEETWAFVRLNPGEQMSTVEVLDYCRAELEAYQVPSQVRFVADFPRTETGKVQKYRLQSEVLAELGKET